MSNVLLRKFRSNFQHLKFWIWLGILIFPQKRNLWPSCVPKLKIQTSFWSSNLFGSKKLKRTWNILQTISLNRFFFPQKVLVFVANYCFALDYLIIVNMNLFAQNSVTFAEPCWEFRKIFHLTKAELSLDEIFFFISLVYD